jgi:hypothetical protein
MMAVKRSQNHSILSPSRLKKIFAIKRKINKPLIKREINTAHLGGVNLSFDFSHPPKLLRIRLMPFENAIFGVKNAILGIADLIKPCNQADKLFIKKKPELWRFSEQRVWCGGWDLNPRRPTPEDLETVFV